MKKLEISKKYLIIGITVITALVLLFVLMGIEESGKGRFIISNNTHRNIDRVVVGFVNDEGDFTDLLFSSSLEAGKKVNDKEDISFSFASGPQEIAIGYTFEGTEQVMMAEGWFTSEFNGKINISFFEKGDKTYLTMKASEGLFGSTARTNLDVKFVLDVDNCDIYYADDYLDDVDE